MAASGSLRSKGWADERYRALIGQLVETRRSKKVSQDDLAAMLGRKQQFVSKVETGERRLDVVEFADYAKALGLKASELIAAVEA